MANDPLRPTFPRSGSAQPPLLQGRRAKRGFDPGTAVYYPCRCCADCLHALAVDADGTPIEGQFVPCSSCGSSVTSSREV